ncbi:MAG TPA: flagellar motor protein MotB, partial [Sulfuricurvum sp.]|nr:flagellar motor protein MotB [Sulfuricurvum sp.]
MARKKKFECKVAPAWLTSFSDLMSLLLTFFILLYSMSSLDVSKAVKFLHYFQGDDAKFEQKVSIFKPIVPFSTNVAMKVKKRISKHLPIHAYQISATEDYVNIRLFNDIFFEKSGVRLSKEAERALDDFIVLLEQIDENLSIN